jgi:hypothetical protein
MRTLLRFLPYIHNGWVNPSHLVIIKHPEYGFGRYHDADTTMLFAMFQILVDFVEIECGSICGPYRFETRLQKIHRVITNLPLLHWLLPPVRNKRRGLHHLRWAMKLQDSPSQAAHAKDVFALYRFWTKQRPNRKGPWDWAETFEEIKRIPNTEGLLSFSPEYSARLDEANELEELYHQEDEAALLLLVKIRRGLWT